jgi:hypothetical protein
VVQYLRPDGATLLYSEIIYRTIFIKYAPAHDDNSILLLMDGHSTHISVGLLEWAKSMNIVIFILPAHTSHLLQPLDVACFGPVQQFMP